MRVKNVTDLGLVIRDRRRALGMDQQTLAGRVGVSRQWVSGVERGKPRAEVGLVLRALRALGLDLSVDPQDEGARSRHEPELPSIDIDAVVDKARGGGDR